jgi:hypothetical protein
MESDMYTHFEQNWPQLLHVALSPIHEVGGSRPMAPPAGSAAGLACMDGCGESIMALLNRSVMIRPKPLQPS